MKYPYKIIFSSRRSISLSVDRDLTVLVKAPRRVKREDIRLFVSRNEEWIDRRIGIQERINAVKEELSLGTAEGKEKRKAFLAALSSRTSYWSEKMGLRPSGIRLSTAEKRFGSCNSRGEIAFSVILMMFSADLIDAVIVHELAHLKEMNHGRRFYSLILDVMPDYRERMRRIKRWELTQIDKI